MDDKELGASLWLSGKGYVVPPLIQEDPHMPWSN